MKAVSLFVSLQVADVVTTALGFQMLGVYEANPVMLGELLVATC